MNPLAQRRGTDEGSAGEPYKDASQEKILTPVGTAIVIVAAVK